MALQDLFTHNISLFLDNAKMILENESLFYVPVSDSPLAFSTEKEFRYPILGVFVEWWLRFPYASRDIHGNPVIYFIGNPMTGSHSCRSIKPEGEIINQCHLNVSWLTTMKTYYEVDRKYRAKKGVVNALSLAEAMEYIKKHSSEENRSVSALESRIMELEGWNNYNTKALQLERTNYERNRQNFLRLIVNSQRKEIGEILDQHLVCEILSNRFREKTTPTLPEMKMRLRRGQVSSKEYQRVISKIHKNQHRLDFDIHKCEMELEWKIFDDYGLRTSFREVELLWNNANSNSV